MVVFFFFFFFFSSSFSSSSSSSSSSHHYHSVPTDRAHDFSSCFGSPLRPDTTVENNFPRVFLGNSFVGPKHSRVFATLNLLNVY